LHTQDRVSSGFRLTLALMVLLTITTHAVEVRSKKAFVTAWEGRAVVLRRPVYSLVYNERSRFVPLMTREDKVSGLTVVTPNGIYYQFDSRREDEPDIQDRDPNNVVTALQNHYRRSAHLDAAVVQDIEGVMLQRYEPGATLLVDRLKVEHDRLRVFLRTDEHGDRATVLTVQWPTPLSKDLVEAPALDALLNMFLARK